MLQIITTREHQTPRPPTSTSATRILVVDDEPDLKRMTATILQRAGFMVETAAEGGEAWDLIQSKTFHLVVTDHHMMPVNGLELIKRIHAQGLNLPVVLTSGKMPTAEIQSQPWLPIKQLLPKPYTPQSLFAAVSLAQQPDATPNTSRSFRPNAAGCDLVPASPYVG